ncbi:hypothetical protein DRH14_01540 [Candidatus Shapirobacteria bacterium]|nr:MAG: hypothetical protein DRH14_01540 [Candidatus Shapirobacteria bacterium]
MAKKNKTIVIVGSHHSPAIELIRQLKQDSKYNWQIHYIGHIHSADTHIHHTILSDPKIIYHNLKSGKFHRRYLPNTIKDIPKIIIAFFKSFLLLLKIKADIVVSFGGYISVPIIITSRLFFIPSVTHEQTLTISLSTKINSYFVNKVALSFTNQPTKIKPSKIAITGNLLRHQIFQQQTKKYQSLTKQLKKFPLIYITGGNQGSQIINQNILKILDKLQQKFTTIHQTGHLNINKFQKLSNRLYHPTDYISNQDIGWVLQKSQIVISRAGANTCQELLALNKKSILIPLYKSQQNEQLKNAKYVKKQLASQTIIINEKQLNGSNLLLAINQLQKIKITPKKNQSTTNFKLLKLIHQLV